MIRQSITNEELHNLAAAVAEELGPNWSYHNNDRDGEIGCWVSVKHDDGYAVLMQTNQEKLNLSSVFHPKAYLGYNVTRPSINVNASKTPAQIAADIKRRLLPDYIPLWQKTEAALESAAAFAAKGEAMGDEVFAMFPAGTAKKQKRSDDGDVFIHFHRENHEGYGEVRVSGASIQMELRSLSVALAKKIITVLAESMKGEK